MENFTENLLSINVTSQNSSLTALDITGSILDILSTRDSESRQLEALLERLTNLGSSATFIEETERRQDDTIANQGFDIDQFIVQNLFLNSIPFKLKQSTTIDLVG